MQTNKLFLNDSYQKDMTATVLAANDQGVLLDRTVFYALSGGQPGDTGVLTFSGQSHPVLETTKGADAMQVWHKLSPDAPIPSVGSMVEGAIDWATRHKYMRMHSCLHLLCALIEGDVTGGSVGVDKGRLDFNIAADAVDKEELTHKLNELITQDHAITFSWIEDAVLTANPHLIRTMSVKPPMGQGQVRLVQIGTQDKIIDLQPCGGTHVKSTGEIGPVVITKIENKGKQNRRISIAFSESDA